MIKKHFDFIELMNPPVHHNVAKKEIFYEAVSSRKFDTDDVQIDRVSNFWLNFTEFHIIF